MKPKILLAANLKKEFYVAAVEACGGIADAQYLPAPSLDYDGLILCGGNDINPARYGEEINGAVNLDLPRDEAEFALAKLYIEAKKPVLGICRGCQLLNVFFGGTLEQDIASSALHRSGTDYYLTHEAVSEKDSILGRMYGEKFRVNSYHHQAVKKLGAGLRVTQWSWNKTVVEGFEHVSLPVLGLQWHPEMTCLSQKREDAVDGIKVFEYFVNLCK